MNPAQPRPGAPVVVVDDEELYLRALAADLDRRGFRVIAHRDVNAAEAAYRDMQLRGETPSLVVDLIQPGDNGGYLGGLDLLRRLRPDAAADVVALADSDAEWLAKAAGSLGARRVIRKPDLRRTEPEHLDRAVQSFLATLSGDAPAAEPLRPSEPSDTDVPAGGTPHGNVLLGALEELRRAPEKVSVLLLVMRVASEIAARGILYEVEGDHLRGLGSFGLDDLEGASMRDRVLELDRDTLPGRAFWSARLQRSRSSETAIRGVGLTGPLPMEAVAIPILGPGGVAAVLYADSGTLETGLPDLRPLSALAGTASLALERLAATAI